MKDLLKEIKNPKNEKQIHELVQSVNKQLETMQDKAQQKAASSDIVESQIQAIETEVLEKNVLRNIMNITDDYSTDTIHSTFIKVAAKQTAFDEQTMTRAVYQALLKRKSDKRPNTKSKPKHPHDTMLNDILTAAS